MASVKVAVRVRPFNQREKDMGAKLIITMDGRKTRIENWKVGQVKDGGVGRARFKDFTFDHSYWSFDQRDPHYASQEKVFDDLGMEVVDCAFEGYNACVFAYGQTGSGKTFTMMGSAESQGLIPRICKHLFGRMHTGKEQGASYRTEVSYLEIYNERVKDLLHRDETGHGLRVREHPRLGPYVQDLSRHLVSDYPNIQELMVRGNNHRTTACTNMNDVSSRSHAIFTLMFVQAGFAGGMPSETVSKVHLVDLAGSERADATGATGQRLKEGAHINKSLVTLGSVISALAELSSGGGGGDGVSHRTSGSRSIFIPYRDSVLTWLLKDSLGGNSKTIMIAAVSPADCNYGETLSTLRYANRAKNIINKPTINEDPNVKLIRELRDEITKLRALLGSEFTMESQPQMVAALHQKEAQEKVLTEEWTEKWRETQQILHEQKTLGLRKSGVGVVLDSDRPHLVGIDDDLLSTGVTLYHLKEGETSIGGEEAPQKQDIVLNGVGVEPEHCSVVLKDGVGTLIPKGNAQCWVNTVLVDKPTRLSQGCIIVLGRTNMFRYNDPAEAAKMRKEGSRSHLNLSRLSLLSWSTSDLDWSTENLHPSVEDSEKADDLEVQRATLLKEKEAFKREQAEKELDWEREQQKKKEALEAAQRELEEERQQMELEYQSQKRRLAEDWQRLERSQQDALLALKAREAELQRRKEDLMREREREAARAEAASKCITALKEEMDLKREALRAFIMEKMTEFGAGNIFLEQFVEGNQRRLSQSLDSLEVIYRKGRRLHSNRLDCCSRRRSDPIIGCCSRWRVTKEERKNTDIERLVSVRELMAKQRQELAKLELELQSKLKLLSSHSECVEKIEVELQSIGDKQEEVKKLVSCEDSESAEFETMRKSLSQRTQEQLESIANRKQSLTLELKSVHGSEDTEPEEKKVGDLSTHETFHTAISDCPVGDRSSWEDDGFMDASRCGSDTEGCAAALEMMAFKINGGLADDEKQTETVEGQEEHSSSDENQCSSEKTVVISVVADEQGSDATQNGYKSEVEQNSLDSPLSDVKETIVFNPEAKSQNGRPSQVLDSRETEAVDEIQSDKNSFPCPGPDSEEREMGEGQSVSPRDSRREDVLTEVGERVVEGGVEEEVVGIEREKIGLDGERVREVGVGGERGEVSGESEREEGVGKEMERMDVVVVVKGKKGKKYGVDGMNKEQSAMCGWSLSLDNGLTIGKAEEAMKRLCAEVEHQKAVVFQSLQNNCDKEEINRQISVLQELQRHYVRLEYAMESPTTSSPVRSRGLETDGEGCDSDGGHFVPHGIEDSRHLGCMADRHDREGNLLHNTMNSSIGVNGTQCSGAVGCYCACNGECITNSRPTGSQSARGSFSESRIRSPSNPALYKSIHGHPRLSYGNLSLGRSMSYSSSLLTPISMDESDPTGSGCGVWVQIPSYHLRGSGSSTHHEYEVKVAMEGEMWTLLRRYRRFRQLHLSLKAKYGTPVEKIPFPPRKFFGKNLESVAKTRKKLLEVYLRHMLSVCSQIESCPLYSCREHPSRLALFEFSSFFRISIFDSGKFGTG